VLREVASYPGNGGDLARIQARARRVLAASGPDPSEVVRAAMAEESARVRMARAEHGIGDFAALETAWLKCVEATRVAVKAYRKAGGK
jgi:predicted secreted protein